MGHVVTPQLYCGGCRKTFEPENVKKCAGCFATFYCGKTCQISHWREHKKECRVAQTIFESYPMTKSRMQNHGMYRLGTLPEETFARTKPHEKEWILGTSEVKLLLELDTRLAEICVIYLNATTNNRPKAQRLEAVARSLFIVEADEEGWAFIEKHKLNQHPIEADVFYHFLYARELNKAEAFYMKAQNAPLAKAREQIVRAWVYHKDFRADTKPLEDYLAGRESSGRTEIVETPNGVLTFNY